jgi:hypothetical protein
MILHYCTYDPVRNPDVVSVIAPTGKKLNDLVIADNLDMQFLCMLPDLKTIFVSHISYVARMGYCVSYRDSACEEKCVKLVELSELYVLTTHLNHDRIYK